MSPTNPAVPPSSPNQASFDFETPPSAQTIAAPSDSQSVQGTEKATVPVRRGKPAGEQLVENELPIKLRRRIVFEAPRRLAEKLSRVARACDVTKTTVLREALELHLRGYESRRRGDK